MGLTSSRPQPIFTQRSMGWGFLQERIVSKRYEGEIFKATMFLVLCNRLVSIASRLAKAWSKQESEQRQIPATGGCTIGVGIFSCLDRFDMIWLRPRWCLSIPNLNRFPEKSAEHFWISNFPPASSCCKSSPNSSRSFFLATLPELSSQVYALIMIMVKGESWRMQAIVWKYLVVSFSNMCRGSWRGKPNKGWGEAGSSWKVVWGMVDCVLPRNSEGAKMVKVADARRSKLKPTPGRFWMAKVKWLIEICFNIPACTVTPRLSTWCQYESLRPSVAFRVGWWEKSATNAP